MRAKESRRRRRHRAGLFLTPMIDIIFLLVIFFILNTSFRQERYIDVNLPVSETSEDVQSEGLVVTLRQDGSVALNGEDTEWAALSEAIRASARENSSTEVIIRADEKAPYGQVVTLMDRIRLAGLEAISLQTVRSGS